MTYKVTFSDGRHTYVHECSDQADAREQACLWRLKHHRDSAAITGIEPVSRASWVAK